MINLCGSIFELEGDVIQKMEIRRFEIRLNLPGKKRLSPILKERIAGAISTKPIANNERKEDVIESGHSGRRSKFFCFRRLYSQFARGKMYRNIKYRKYIGEKMASPPATVQRLDARATTDAFLWRGRPVAGHIWQTRERYPYPGFF